MADIQHYRLIVLGSDPAGYELLSNLVFSPLNQAAT